MGANRARLTVESRLCVAIKWSWRRAAVGAGETFGAVAFRGAVIAATVGIGI